MKDTLNELLKDLKEHGCHPSIYRRGRYWRAHVNQAGNFWHDGTTPLSALMEAMRLWKKAGCPMDGDAAGGG